MSLNDCRHMVKIQKQKIVCMGTKPTLEPFIGAFLGVVQRERVVVPTARITMLYGALYEHVWLWRYTAANMAPGMKIFPTRGDFFNFFSMTLLEFALVSEKAIKKFSPRHTLMQNYSSPYYYGDTSREDPTSEKFYIFNQKIYKF